jgi:hypothetical protein
MEYSIRAVPSRVDLVIVRAGAILAATAGTIPEETTMARVLVVDDKPNMRWMLQEALNKAGHTPHAVASEPEALTLHFNVEEAEDRIARLAARFAGQRAAVPGQAGHSRRTGPAPEPVHSEIAVLRMKLMAFAALIFVGYYVLHLLGNALAYLTESLGASQNIITQSQYVPFYIAGICIMGLMIYGILKKLETNFPGSSHNIARL